MKRNILMVAAALLLVLAAGCGSYGVPVAGYAFTASPPAGTQSASIVYVTAAPQTAEPQPADTPLPTEPATEPAETQAPTAPPATPQPTAPAVRPTGTAPHATASPTAATAATGSFLQVEPVSGTANVEKYLPLRASPSNSSAVLKKIPKAGSFAVVKVAQDPAWLRVSYAGETGYVLAQFVVIAGNAANRVCTVVSGAVNMRAGAGKKYDVLGMLENGATVIVTAKAQASAYTWYQIQAGGKTGYVDGDYCRVSQAGG